MDVCVFVAGRSSCQQAMLTCNASSSCSRRFQTFQEECEWQRSDNTCNRADCLVAIRKFYLLVRPTMTHALLFCKCAEGDKVCGMVRRALFPICTVAEVVPPTCGDVISRCEEDPDCKYVKWYWYRLRGVSLNWGTGSYGPDKFPVKYVYIVTFQLMIIRW